MKKQALIAVLLLLTAFTSTKAQLPTYAPLKLSEALETTPELKDCFYFISKGAKVFLWKVKDTGGRYEITFHSDRPLAIKRSCEILIHNYSKHGIVYKYHIVAMKDEN